MIVFITSKLSLIRSFLALTVLLQVQVLVLALNVQRLTITTHSQHVSRTHNNVLFLRTRPSSSSIINLENNGAGERQTSIEYCSRNVSLSRSSWVVRSTALKSNTQEEIANDVQIYDETNYNEGEDDGGNIIAKSSSPKRHDIVQNTMVLLSKDLWILPVLSLLSGIPPSVRIIGESHISRLPDCPIAHDIDTLLLWPAVMGLGGNDGISPTPPLTIFKVPNAAITDEAMYGVDWSSVLVTYGSNVATSLLISFMLAFSLLLFIGESENEQLKTNE